MKAFPFNVHDSLKFVIKVINCEYFSSAFSAPSEFGWNVEVLHRWFSRIQSGSRSCPRDERSLHLLSVRPSHVRQTDACIILPSNGTFNELPGHFILGRFVIRNSVFDVKISSMCRSQRFFLRVRDWPHVYT